MSAPAIIQGLSQVATAYDALLCDVWGVVHNGRERFAPACQALARFRAERGPVILISNAPRPAADVLPQLDGLGVPRAAWSAMVTSGDATRTLLAERAPGPAWAIGPARDAPLYEGLGLSFTDATKAAFIACTGPVDDTTETPEDYRDRLRVGAARGLVMICANPDRVVQRGDRLVYCGGALADLYEELGGAVVMAGKPHAPIYDLALERAAAELGRPLARERVLSVGDGIATDLAGAAAQGLDALFVAHGIHASELALGDGPLDPARLDAFLSHEGAAARFAMRALAW
ncbi:MAG TPA: TIGR01459 family HAD-type hydrolase [Caulobacteraceae bacterium]|nr:TIGR01459 family HAD-type hydrolase [Caulobacteraceae bacterium]